MSPFHAIQPLDNVKIEGPARIQSDLEQINVKCGGIEPNA